MRHAILDEPHAVTSTAPVTSCEVEDCSYNTDFACFAPAIAVGDAHAACDTFTVGPASISATSASVERCLVADCMYNRDACCDASGVQVRHHSAHADCATYRPGA